ncbi:MAG: sugar ABC transporter ATP-binding protein [Bacillota bacterium]
MRGITKEFGGVSALKNVDLTVEAGQIHALLGENGAGKTTLLNILFGMPVIRATGGYRGTISIHGVPFSPKDPSEALAAGIGMVHQEFMLIPGFTVAENVKLNREPLRHASLGRVHPSLHILDRPAMAADTRQAFTSIGVNVDDWMMVAGLPVGHKQFVEIAREVDKHGTKLLILDEPTAVLTEVEAAQLIEALRRLAARGLGILFITHRLDEVLACASQISVLRDGELVACLPAAEASLRQLAEVMVGRPVERQPMPPRGTVTGASLRFEGFSVEMPGERVTGLDLEVQAGEILGIGGLAGHGKLGIANGVMGLYPARGQVSFDGEPFRLGQPIEALSRRIAFLSEDRRGVGLLLDAPIDYNLAFTSMNIEGRFLKRPLGVPWLTWRDSRGMRTHAEALISQLDIRCTGPDQAVRRLSGGNQQKVCIGRAITRQPRLLFASEPTRGIDVGAKSLILDLLARLNREAGVTIVITSSELAELRRICDRIAIIYRGRLARVLPPDASDADFGLAMAGRPPGGDL